MVIFKGDKRIFDKTISEVSTSTSNNRIIEITGLKSLDELTNVPLYIKTTQIGIPICTLEVRNESTSLGSINIKTYSNGILTNPKNNWIYSGQTYLLIYNGTNALVSNTSEYNNNCSVSADILNLTSTSTKSEITEAFKASESNTIPILDFIQAISYSKPISLYDDSSDTVTKVLNVIEQKTEVVDTITYYTISVLMPSINAIRSLKFKQINSSVYLFDSVEVTTKIATAKEVYSMEETIVGEWFGKPLYRKGFTGELGADENTQLVLASTLNMDELVDYKGIIKRDDHTTVIIGKSGITGSNDMSYIWRNNDIINIVTDSGLRADWSYKVCLEYTKTTD